MAKRTRGRALHETGEATAPVRPRRPTRPRRRPAAREQGLLDRYRGALIAGVALVGVVIIGFIFLQSATGAAYECRNLLTPGPVETPPTPRPPTPIPSPTAQLTAVPSPTSGTSPSPAASPGAGTSPSPGASPATGTSPSPAASPAAGTSPSPGASPTAGASPTGAPSPTPEPSPTAAPTARLGFAVDDLGRIHAPTGQQLTYDYCPPASGPHYNDQAPNPAPLPPAVYPPSQERAPGYWVHNLEHGYIVVLYRCPSGELGEGDCITREEMSRLETFFEQSPDPPVSTCPNKTVVARFDEMDTRFAILAWDRALLVDEFDVDQAHTFAEQWMEFDPIVLPEIQAC